MDGAASGPAPPPPPMSSANNNEAAVERMRRLVSDDPGVITQIMRPQPVFSGGTMRGFRVYPGANRQAFARMGLRPGDLVTAVNGTPLTDKDRASEIFNTLSSSSEARVSVTRNGRQQELVLNIAQIAAEAEQLGAPADGNIPMDQAPPEPDPGNE
jgi:general secretion pathway protein C